MVSVAQVKHELKRLRRGQALAHPAVVMQLSPTLRAHLTSTPGSPEGQPDDVLMVVDALRQVVGRLGRHEQLFARVDFNLLQEHSYPTLTERQESLARVLKCTAKTVRRHSSRALETIALLIASGRDIRMGGRAGWIVPASEPTGDVRPTNSASEPWRQELGLEERSEPRLDPLDSQRIIGTTEWTPDDALERRGTPSQRRHLMKLGGTSTLASILELLSVESDRMNEALDTGTVSDDRIQRFESIADWLGLQAVKVTPTSLLGDAVVTFRSVRRLVQQKQTTSDQIRLQRVGAKLGIVVGEILFIEGYFDVARQWYQTAQHAASAAGDRFLADIALASEAYLPTYSDDPQGVLSLVTPRLEQRAHPTPGIAWLWAFKAKAHAQLGERAKFEEAIGEAHIAMSKSKPELVRPGIYSFLPEKLAFYEATGYVKLRDVDDAVQATEHALELYDLTDTTEPALVRFNKASALAESGEIPEACEVASGALLDRYTYPSVSVMTAARDFDSILGDDDSTAVRDWRERLVTIRREPARLLLPEPDA